LVGTIATKTQKLSMPRRKSTHVDDPKEVGRRLRDARERAGLSQRQLSFPGCSPAYISRIEAGDRIPSLQLLREMGRRLGVTEDYLATGTERGDDAVRLIEADLALRLDERELAERLYREVLEKATSSEERARALAGLGQLAFAAGDPRTAIKQLGEARTLGVDDPEVECSLADTLGRAYAMVDDLDAAVGVFRSSLEAAEAREDTVEAVRFAVLLANTHIDMAEFDEARVLLEKCVSMTQDSRDPVLRARLYWSHSRLHAIQSDTRTAARYARRALELLELTEHTQYTARAHQLLAHVEIDGERPEEALELLHAGLELLGQSATPVDRALFGLEQARALVQLGRREEAAAIAMEASGLLKDASPHDAGRGYAVIADIFAELGDTARARELYELAAEVLAPIPSRYSVEVHSKLADLLEAEGKKDEALAVLKRAVGVRSQPA
jgi:tetratricopeptide (TPR) repeat protein